jgi:aminoglycoside 6'-N-acetyltransferase
VRAVRKAVPVAPSRPKGLHRGATLPGMTVFAPPETTIRPILPEDAPALAAILAQPSVARWWGDFDQDRVERDLIVGEPDMRVYAIEVDGRLVGAIQSVEEPEPEFRHAGIDLFLDDDVQGQGVGPNAIRILARRLIDEDGHHRITIDPAAENEHAISAYEKVGFRRVGTLRSYQRMGDGTWADGLLMELLADDLID